MPALRSSPKIFSKREDGDREELYLEIALNVVKLATGRKKFSSPYPALVICPNFCTKNIGELIVLLFLDMVG